MAQTADTLNIVLAQSPGMLDLGGKVLDATMDGEKKYANGKTLIVSNRYSPSLGCAECILGGHIFVYNYLLNSASGSSSDRKSVV